MTAPTTAAPTTAAPASRVSVQDLLDAYRSQLIPAVAEFIENRTTASEFRQQWREYYYGPFRSYDMALSRVWHETHGSAVGVLPGPPDTQDGDAPLLNLFTISIHHHNLHRLVNVLAEELVDRTAEETVMPQRIADLGHIVDALEQHVCRFVDSIPTPQ